MAILLVSCNIIAFARGGVISPDAQFSMAQSICAGLDHTAQIKIAAVRKPEHGPLSCSEICQDGTLRLQFPWLVANNLHGKCIDALHIFGLNTFPTEDMKLGPLTFFYGQ